MTTWWCVQGLGEGFVGLCMGFQCHGYHLPTIATVESCAQLHVHGKIRVCNIGSRTWLWFLKEFQSRISFLFGTDDHWGRLSLLADIFKEIPQLKMVVERKGHLHTLSCNKASLKCVALNCVSHCLSTSMRLPTEEDQTALPPWCFFPCLSMFKVSSLQDAWSLGSCR
jgi:hypothetical protein